MYITSHLSCSRRGGGVFLIILQRYLRHIFTCPLVRWAGGPNHLSQTANRVRGSSRRTAALQRLLSPLICGLLLLADLCGLLGLTKPASLDFCSSKTPCFIAGMLNYVWLTKIQFSKASLPRVTSLLPWIPAPVRTHRFLTGLSRHSWLIEILLKKALLESITHGFLFAS